MPVREVNMRIGSFDHPRMDISAFDSAGNEVNNQTLFLDHRCEDVQMTVSEITSIELNIELKGGGREGMLVSMCITIAAL
jgi:hypothetical protein